MADLRYFWSKFNIGEKSDLKPVTYALTWSSRLHSRNLTPKRLDYTGTNIFKKSTGIYTYLHLLRRGAQKLAASMVSRHTEAIST